jgi:hypothetical protein
MGSMRVSGRTSPSCRLFLILGELFGRKENKRSANALSRATGDPCGGIGTAKPKTGMASDPTRLGDAGALHDRQESGIRNQESANVIGRLTPES